MGSTINLDELASQVVSVINYVEEDYSGAECNYMTVRNMMDTWYDQKKVFIDNFLDGELIKELPYSQYPLGEKRRENAFGDFLEALEEEYGFIYEVKELLPFLSLNEEGFFDNKVIRVPEDKQGKIKEGMKLSKSFKFYIPDNPQLLRKVQDFASRYIQQDLISGSLCISVHPLDFLTASENTFNWDSCFALTGCYKTGSMSYLLDNSTMISYLKDKNEDRTVNMPFDWNNKKWRAWLFFSTNQKAVFSGRHYPFESEVLIDAVRDKLLNNDEIEYGPWRRDYITEYKGTALTHDRYLIDTKAKSIVGLSKIIEDCSSLHYNDLLISPVYKQPFFATSTYDDVIMNKMRFKIGANIPCLAGCGGHVSSSESFICDSCRDNYEEENLVACSCCGDYINEEDVYYVGDTPLCADCFAEKTFHCDHCNEDYFLDNYGYYDSDRDEVYCDSCWEEIQEEREENGD